jgi:small subunit ribosomal protein S4e
MVKNHLKRIAAPRTWPILRKENVFVLRPSAGKKFELSLPIGFVLKELLQAVQTTKELKAVLSQKQVLVNAKVVSDIAYPLGLYDLVTIVPTKTTYRLVLSSLGKLQLVKTTSSTRVCKVISKKTIGAKKTQIGTLNGQTTTQAPAQVRVGDSIVIEAQKVSKHLPLQVGSYIQFIGGRHIGTVGHVKTIDAQVITVELADKTVVETLKEYAFVIGEKKPEIEVQ